MQWLGKSEITPKQLSVNAQHPLVNFNSQPICSTSVFPQAESGTRPFLLLHLIFSRAIKLQFVSGINPIAEKKKKKKRFLSHFFIPVINISY